jgi:hypothetical protein
MKKRWLTLLAGCGALMALNLIPAVVARAQDPNAPDATPKPAGRAYPPLDDPTTNDDQPSPDQLLPDSRPLTGVQSPTLGRIESPHSYWEPGFQYSNTTQNNLPGALNSGWTTTNYLAANVSLLESWRSSQLAVNYSGGGDFSTDKTIGNGAFQQLGLSQTFQWTRWQVQFLDQFSYLPESEFGFGGGTSLGLAGGGVAPGVPQTGLSSSLQSLFTAVGPRYNNNFTTQVVYQLTPRASVNVSGTYGILRFVDSGNVDTDNAGASIGYNYQLSKEDTIGLVYRFSRFSYVANPQTIDDNVINVAYGKKITGRLALQIFGGPDITTFSIPIGGISRQVSGSGGGSLTYAFNRADSVSLNYTHGVTPGSGVFAGAVTDQLGASIGHAFTRVWSAQANVGYAKNRSVVNAGSQNSFDSYYFGGGVNRPFGPNTNFSIAYSAHIQSMNALAGCIGSSCSSTFTQHQIVMNFQWHTRPLVLR